MQTKLRAVDRALIRLLAQRAVGTAEIASRFGISPRHAARIARGWQPKARTT